jgi:ACS family tartrate transporter-like MFS transporter
MSAAPDRTTEVPGEELLERQVLRKVTRRLLPFLGLLYFVNILDRVNISFARLHTMLTDLNMSEQAYALGAGIFFVGYCLLEVPSNLILSRLGARRWLARILVSWGLLSAGMMFVTGAWSFVLLRFLLGSAEAGFFPGVVLYLTYWFPARQRARAVALLMAAAPLVWVLGGPFSGALLELTHGRAGLAGWQWLFLLEGLPAVALGVVTLAYLPDRPGQARWLTPEERDWLTERLAEEDRLRQHRHGEGLWQVAADRRVWHLIALAGTIALGISGMAFYFPRLVQDRFPTLNAFQVGLLTAVAGASALLSIVAVGAHSDRTGERRWHAALPAFLATAGWALGVWREVPLVSYLGLILAHAAMLSMWAPFWSLATGLLGARAAAGGIALINALANLAAFLGPIIMGWLLEATGHFAPGLVVMALTLLLGGILVLGVRQPTAAGSNRPA